MWILGCDVPPEALEQGDFIHVIGLGFAEGNGTAQPPVTAETDGVPLVTEIRLVFDGWLDPATIEKGIVLRSGGLERGTVTRWDFQAGDDFDDLTDDEPAFQVVALRATIAFDRDNGYTVATTDELRGLFGEPVEPFSGDFTTGEEPGGDLPVEPPEAPADPSAYIEGNLWNDNLGAKDPRRGASCGWLYGPCHRLVDPGADYGTDFVDYTHTTPAMDLLLCELVDGGCAATFASDEWKDLYDFSTQWPGLRIVDPGRPEASYLVYKVLGIPGISGVPMPRHQADRAPFLALNPFTEDELDEFENRSNFVGIAQAFRQWIAAGAVPPSE